MEEEKFEFKIVDMIEEGDYKVFVRRNGFEMTELKLGGEGSKGFGGMRLYLDGGDDGEFDYKIQVSLGNVGRSMDINEVYEFQAEINKLMKTAEKLQSFIENVKY